MERSCSNLRSSRVFLPRRSKEEGDSGEERTARESRKVENPLEEFGRCKETKGACRFPRLGSTDSPVFLSLLTGGIRRRRGFSFFRSAARVSGVSCLCAASFARHAAFSGLGPCEDEMRIRRAGKCVGALLLGLACRRGEETSAGRASPYNPEKRRRKRQRVERSPATANKETFRQADRRAKKSEGSAQWGLFSPVTIL